MSTFTPGTGGTLESTNLPSAFLEVSRVLVQAENTRNAANSGVAPINNITASLSIDGGVASIAATIPIAPTLSTSGVPTIAAQNYLGSTYTTFAPGTGGTLKSTNTIAAFLETAQLLASAEKAVTPVENQPNNIQITYDLEASQATISANLPFSSTSVSGDITIEALDYL
ncbi:hypothetical protein Syn7502_00829 [Synechococcus sp. PCC 7502]|uniref:hypothetical protein n=1 Tax=Synechococcus sp. PCC 7502 TaxID=1173263 RepID=UPI00029F978B|nr:hypothetical protein [Synechococcus sp. PCC 7502]AFY72961.1 hypothetical protein Syn7502_00829 [Synechococcus sp. PCC 7502]